MDQLGSIDQKLFLIIDKMKVGEYSKPSRTQSPDGKEAYNIFYLKSQTEPHVANLKDDYQRIQQAALVEKQNTTIQRWINDKAKKTFIKIDDEFKDCPFAHRWANEKQQ